MRIYKFRAWHRQYEKMHKFNLHDLDSGSIAVFNPNFNDQIHHPSLPTYWHLDDCEIMMWTGLTDRHGVEIWEGDIVNVLNYLNGKVWEGHTHIDEVIFSNGKFDIKNPWCSESLQSNEVEVIGSIYDRLVVKGKK